jgi:hypothetical protein
MRRHSVAGDGAEGLLPPLPLVLSPPPPPQAEEKRHEQLQLETDKMGIDDFWQRLEASNLRTKQKAADTLVSSEASIALIKVVVDKVNSFLLAYFRRSAALPLPIPTVLPTVQPSVASTPSPPTVPLPITLPRAGGPRLGRAP